MSAVDEACVAQILSGADYDYADYGAADTCNVFGLTEFNNRTSFFNGDAIFSQATGYALLAGGGLFFTLLISALTWIEHKFAGTVSGAEEFNTCNRSVKTGLIMTDIVAHWSWNSVMLYSPVTFVYYGISGPFWDASCGSAAILIFAVVALELKRKAPTAHTILEVIKHRWGRFAHVVFLITLLQTNWFVSVTNILGGIQVVSALTGMSLYAGAMLFPIGTLIYSAVGGLKAGLTSSYIHTIIIMVAMMLFIFKVYVGGYDGISGISTIYKNLNVMAKVKPVVGYAGLGGNRGGNYLTFLSMQGFGYGLVDLTGNTPFVFSDQSYWQQGIAAKPSSAVWAYAVAGVLWFAIPMVFSLSTGIAAVAYDLPFSGPELNNVLLLPGVAITILGQAGGALVLLIIFMSTTSAITGEFIGVSTLLTFDIWKEYIRPKASAKELLLVSRLSVVLFGMISAVSTVIVIAANFNFSWFFLISGIFSTPAVPALAAVLFSKRVPAGAAIWGTLFGDAMTLVSWLALTYTTQGSITIATTQELIPVFSMGLVGTAAAVIVIVGWTWMWPDDFDWNELRKINLVDNQETGFEEEGPDSMQGLLQARKWVLWLAVIVTLLYVVLWPCLACAAEVFSEGMFTLYVVISFIYGFLASVVFVFLPIWDARHTLKTIFLNMLHGRTARPLFSSHALVPNFEDYSIGGTKLAQKVEDLKPQASGSQAGLLEDDSAHHGNILDPKLAA